MDVDGLRAVTREDLDARLRDLPVLPSVVMRLMSSSPNSESYFDDVLSLAESDPPFAARIISSANSSASAPVCPVEGLPNAVARLGARHIGEIVTGIAVTRVFVPTAASQRQLWIYSLEVANISRAVAIHCGFEDVCSDQVYLAGLLHDLGRFVMFDETPDQLNEVDDSGWHTPDELVAAEQAMCGFDHGELGWRACSHWGIPDAIGLVVRNHHSHKPDAFAEESSPAKRSTAIVQLADRLSMFQAKDSSALLAEPEEVAQFIRDSGFDEWWDPGPISASDLSLMLSGCLGRARELSEGLGLISTD